MISKRALLVAAICAPASAHAIDFTAGGWTGSLNTTVSYGQLYRNEQRDPRLIGTANGGIGRSPNIDDGNRTMTKASSRAPRSS